ncbi:type III secretion system export apparatus subunit SctV [Paraburkholderia bonniea]|uniref:type III secretion system export apparatus subunit SctV n=1 Tax=Paraburkholderia bonniea TaxID=2152891 RepID=UPI00129188F8|nr:type III secretion system export apparatus subunit SctV [Paraburkholderia bonniea]WJF89321.1 type III secretion system export apparatus subunit SctV [Paraburkholderia bonniea]WJF92637.1 type III secretion system export apparatus subunit SctV [Paraburkholderia bonniea]
MLHTLRAQFQRLIFAAMSRGDLMLAAGVLGIIFIMILPLPTLVVDILIAFNMSVAVTLLLVALYLPSPLHFASFPSVLLVTTLFRLGISIATTRLILLQADAGHIVYTFGNFVVGGNLVVGLVVFLILTIVQFVVITKGAERVAEVAARFSLDAMPGKQMSIDGDLRAGSIDMDEARKRRSLVEKESQLYGAMDGAMKFVKGDAIAGLIIVAVNLIGGLIIGTMQNGMSASEAMSTYSVLTIGDGLIAQIPALFIAISAGMIVTRVSTDTHKGSNVGKDISAQVLARPRALLIAAAAMLTMALIPGMPSLIFVILSFALAAVGYALSQATPEQLSKAEGATFGDSGTPAASGDSTAHKAPMEYATAVPVMLDVHAGLKATFGVQALNDELIAVRQALYNDLGVPFPGIQLRFNPELEAGRYVILLNEVPVASGHVRPESLLVRESARNLDALGVAHETERTFLPGIPTIWVSAKLQRLLNDAGIGFFTPTKIFSYHLAAVLKRYSADFIGIQETKSLLSGLESRFGELIKEATRILPAQKIAEILQRLVSEGVSIRNLRTILEALIEWGQKEKDSVLLTEYVRSALKRQISHRHSSSQNVLSAYMLTPDVEETLRDAVRQTSAGSYLALDPDVSKKLLQNIIEMVGDIGQATLRPVLLTSMDIRRYLRKMIEADLYELAVLSYQELATEINIQPLGRIGL